MSNYQPFQSLTWRYSTGSGNLSVVSTIYVEVAPGEKILCTVSPFQGNTSNISLYVDGTLTSPLTEVIFLQNIGTGYTSVEQVRAVIKTISVKTVVTTFYIDNTIAGEAVNNTSSNSLIKLVS